MGDKCREGTNRHILQAKTDSAIARAPVGDIRGHAQSSGIAFYPMNAKRGDIGIAKTETESQ